MISNENNIILFLTIGTLLFTSCSKDDLPTVADPSSGTQGVFKVHLNHFYRPELVFSSGLG